jgi:hypothetical protein
MSQSAVSRIWWPFGLKPHIIQTWKLSTDPEFIEKVRDVAGLYMAPPDNALMLCADEKSQIQATLATKKHDVALATRDAVGIKVTLVA